MKSNGFKLGVLLLETKFVRVRGEIGNPETFPFHVVTRTVRDADVQRVVAQGDAGLVPLFVEEGRFLEREGASLIAASCGFLARYQEEIGRALSVPFISSSLLILPLLEHMFGRQRTIGVITASARHLTGAHFRGVGAGDVPVKVVGMDDCEHFNQAIVREEVSLEPEFLETEVVNVVREFILLNPDIPAVVLECTNLSPYRKAVQMAISRPVFDIISLVSLFVSDIQGSD